MALNPRRASEKEIASFLHEERRAYLPTAEMQPVMDAEDQSPIQVAYVRRNRDLDPQLVWRGKDEQDWSDLVVSAPPLFVQEKIHPKFLIDDLRRQTEGGAAARQLDLFADFNGLPEGADRTDFYQHDAHWSNRMILGDSLQVMASLAEREGLRGQVQCIYLDPPYGIKFNSNFQWSTTSRDVRDGNPEHITREPEQVKAFRDTWRDGIHSYLTYLRDRLTVARDLLTDSGSIFVQIGDENVHRVRALMDEVFGEENFIAQISSKTSGGSTGVYLPGVVDYILWFGRDREATKYRELFGSKGLGEDGAEKYSRVRLPNLERRSLTELERQGAVQLPAHARVYRQDNLTSQSVGREKGEGAASWFPVAIEGREVLPSTKVRWKTNVNGMDRLLRADRVELTGNSLAYVRYLDDFLASQVANAWTDIGGIQSRADPKVYVVQTPTTVIQRCLLMATDPGDLVLDPTCGSGTTAYVAEQWGRRWITIDTSRVALALARARIMGARYPYYLLADSPEGQLKEAEVTRTAPSSQPVFGNLRHGFVYERVPHIQLGDIARNAEIDVIWERFQETLEPLRAQLNAALGTDWEEWQIPREAGADWPEAAKEAHAEWWRQRVARQKEIDASIAAKAEFEYLYDKPYVDSKKVRVAGPFTVESLSPHRALGVGENDELIDPLDQVQDESGQDFASMILENLRTAGVQQAHKDDRITFTALAPWPGELVCAEGVYEEGGGQKRAGIFIGPEFGTVSRPDLAAAAREAADAGFDVLIACAFNYDALSTELNRLGRVPVLKARMNADLHMASDLKNTGKGNLFVVFGEPDISILDAGPEGAPGQIRVRVNGVDVFHPSTGRVQSDGPDGIACWFIDTDYNEESFFVRHAYFLGANDPYKALKTTLKAEIDEEAWESLHSDTSRPFDRPQTGRIAVKVINHLGDEVMKVFRVE
jgi:adenine-specific DNA-methyltransferase